MRGHIQQRGKSSWRLKVFVGRDAAGVRRYVQRTVRGTRREAERELARVVVEVDEGRHAAAAPMTFGELLDRWLDVKRRTVEAKTLESYEWVARRYVRPRLAARKVASLRALDLDELYSELQARGLSPRTVRICHTVARQSLEQARRWGLIARNPAVDATPPPQRRSEITPPTVAQVQQLIDAARRRRSRLRHVPVAARGDRVPAGRGVRAALDRRRPRAGRGDDPPVDHPGGR